MFRHHRHFGRHFGREFGHGHGHGPGRGHLRYEILSVLADGPRHGYDVMLELEKRRGGFRPRPGSIYPALQMLEDGGFVRATEVDGKRVFEITDTGRTSLSEHKERGGFDRDADEESARELFIGGATSLRALIEAAKQAARLGNPRVIGETIAILDKARREVYKLLADIE